MHISEIIKQWDINAEKRYEQIKSGKDISYNHILVPTILSLLGDISGKRGIDLGCGPGVLTNLVARNDGNVVGIDFSEKMIDIARRECGRISNVDLICISAKNYLSKIKPSSQDFLVANMFFNTVPDINEVFNKAFRVLRRSGIFVFSVAHPCFWNMYRHIFDKCSYDYIDDACSKWKFKISLDSRGLPEPVYFFHRPLSEYTKYIINAGFCFLDIVEPMPKDRIATLYPRKWEYPHFLFFKLVKS